VGEGGREGGEGRVEDEGGGGVQGRMITSQGQVPRGAVLRDAMCGLALLWCGMLYTQAVSFVCYDTRQGKRHDSSSCVNTVLGWPRW
jgi:hypothetical protein